MNFYEKYKKLENDLYEECRKMVTNDELTQEEAEEKLTDAIDEGRKNPPDQCYDRGTAATEIREVEEDKNDMEELSDHLIGIVARNDERFSFECGVCHPEQAKIEIFDKEKKIGYIVKIEPIEYDENGEPVNI
jgi:hypothetical protein